MSAEHLQKRCYFISLLLACLLNHMDDITQVFLVYAPILHISASSQSANNQFLKIQVTSTPFQISIKEVYAYRFSNIDNFYDNAKMVKNYC